MISHSKFLSTALQAVAAAQQVLDRYYQSDVRVQIKADKSLVTVADQEAEKIIKQTISSIFPSHSFLGVVAANALLHQKVINYLNT